MPTKILVIEDDRSLAKAYLTRLAQEGFVASVAHDGVEGLAQIQAERPDIVLLDLLMPVMDGYAVLTALASAENAIKAIPVVVLSNFGQDAEIARAKSLGAVDYLVKSNVSLADVVVKIKAIVDKNA